MLKVFYILDTLQTGGAEKSTLDIASRIGKFEVVVCHIYKNDFLKKEFQKRGIRVISLDIEGPYDFVKAYRALKNVLKKERPSLVIATLLRTELISRIACRTLKIPNIGTFVNDTYSKYEWQALSLSMKLKVGFFWFFNMITARACAGFLSNSESIKTSNCKALFIPREKVHVIYRGRRTDVFSYTERTPSGPLKFLAVGRLLYRKGFEELLHAFQLYENKYPGATLTIAGEGPHRKTLEQLVALLSLQRAVKLPGNIKDIAAEMRGHDVFVFPSHYEGFSGTLVEAMLSGIPVLASDISMNKEAVTHGKTGRLFQVKDVQSMLESMVWITHHPETALEYARKAREVAAARFDIDLVAQQHEQYYQNMLASLSA
jgi:glycosyltransferase involved in cell wall biosynthesis